MSPLSASSGQHGHQRTGQAILRIVGRRDAYEGDVTYDGVSVYLDGCPRIVDGPDSAPRVSYRARTQRQWPLRRVEEIHWLDEEAA